MAVTLTPLLHTTPYTRDFLRDENSQQARDDLRVYSTDEVDDLVAGIGGLAISDFVRSLLGLESAGEFRNALDVYSTSEVYNTGEVYNTTETYTKTETDAVIANAVSNVAVTVIGGGTGTVISVNGYTGVVVLAQSDIAGLVSALATKATTTQLQTSVNTINASITSQISSVNAAISNLGTTTQTALNLKADATTLSNYATVTNFNALSSTVATHTANIAAASTRIATLEGSNLLLTESRFVTGALTVAATDAGEVIRTGAATVKFASNTTVPIATNSYGYVMRGSGAGAVTFQALGGVNFVSPLNLTNIADQGGMVMWWKQAANTIVLSGDLG